MYDKIIKQSSFSSAYAIVKIFQVLMVAFLATVFIWTLRIGLENEQKKKSQAQELSVGNLQ